MIALLALVPARYLAAAGLLFGAAGAVVCGMALHDRGVRAQLVATQAAARAAADAAQHQRIVAALGTALADQREAAQRAVEIKEAIAHAPETHGCADSPAVAAALRGLHRDR
jgi:hypothetical protein